MKETELRVGNLIYILGYSFDPLIINGIIDGFVRIESLPKKNVISIRDCDPIPFTEEWLEKFGFIKPEDAPGVMIKQRPDKESFVISHKLMSNKNGLWHESTEIKYVHSLQNLYFAWTGEELKVKELVSG